MPTHRVTVVGHKTFEVESGAKLAWEIEQSGYDISHRCGGHARCTTCRVKFLTEEPPMGKKEHDSLEEDGVLGEFRLSCQIPVDRDMEVEVLIPVHKADWDNPGEDLEQGFEED
ncbi:MAG TPA: 2Fe-2S iron-sulfur cluster-binding protein [Fimbriimonadaceae bacterium]|nr:2Fe-2S iron-sulfur cluster-binding protein [Fimbriimonadaceae bacterium]